MSEHCWTLQEVASKADDEGGLDELYRWGLKASEAPEEIQVLWDEYINAMHDADLIADKIYKILPSPGGDED